MGTLKSFLKSLPLIAGLANCNASDYKQASKDIATNFICSTMPIWLGTYITLLLSQETSTTFISALIENISNGELFLFATATLGPIIYIAFADIEGGNNFPTKLSHSIFITIVVLLSACSFGLQRANLEMNTAFTFNSSVFLFLFAWILLSLATVYKRQSIPSASAEFKKNEREFSEELNSHRRKES